MAGQSSRRHARRLTPLLLVASLSTALWLTMAGPTFACSCMEGQPMAAYGGAEHAIFSGTAGPKDARGVPVRVDRWFSGAGAAPIVYLAAGSFSDSSSCGTNVPPAGTAWIWVTFLPEGGDPLAGLCTPQGQLGTIDGDAMLADAASTYGGVAPPGTIATDPPEAAPQPPVSAELGVPIALATVGLGLAVLLGAVVLARRRSRAGA